MILFRFIDFLFRITATCFLVLLLQVTVAGRTLEDYILSFIRTGTAMEPIRNDVNLGVKQIKTDTLAFMKKQKISTKNIQDRGLASRKDLKLLENNQSRFQGILNTVWQSLSASMGISSETSHSKPLTELKKEILKPSVEKIAEPPAEPPAEPTENTPNEKTTSNSD